jgi:hypothetical protein
MTIRTVPITLRLRRMKFRRIKARHERDPNMVEDEVVEAKEVGCFERVDRSNNEQSKQNDTNLSVRHESRRLL